MATPCIPTLARSALLQALSRLWSHAWVRWLLFLLVFLAAWLFRMPVAHATLG